MKVSIMSFRCGQGVGRNCKLFCHCEISGRPSSGFQTAAAGSRDPVWKHEHAIDVCPGDTLEFQVFDAAAADHGLVGNCTLHAEQFAYNGFNGEITVSHVGLGIAGLLRVRVSLLDTAGMAGQGQGQGPAAVVGPRPIPLAWEGRSPCLSRHGVSGLHAVAPQSYSTGSRSATLPMRSATLPTSCGHCLGPSADMLGRTGLVQPRPVLGTGSAAIHGGSLEPAVAVHPLAVRAGLLPGGAYAAMHPQRDPNAAMHPQQERGGVLFPFGQGFGAGATAGRGGGICPAAAMQSPVQADLADPRLQAYNFGRHLFHNGRS